MKNIDLQAEPLKKKVAKALFDTFVYNDNFFAEQLDDHTYRPSYKPLTPSVLERMLKNKGSCLTYLHKKNQIKWICLDFDIDKSQLNTSHNKLNKLLENLLNSLKVACQYLDEKGIKYLVEFSGNRGFHIWIIFSEEISTYVGHKIVSRLKAKFSEEPKPKGSILTTLKNWLKIATKNPVIINIDIFPHTNHYETRVGKGVKIPLSLHKKSNNYSFLIANIHSFHIDDNIWWKELNQDRLQNQSSIMENYNSMSLETTLSALNIELSETEGEPSNYVKIKKAEVEDVEPSDVINSLCKCSVVNKIIKNSSERKISNQERVLLTALVNRIETENNPNFGKETLIHYFSQLHEYNEKVTRKKLENLHLYPTSCSHLQAIFPNDSCPCITNAIKSPIELLPEVTFVTESIFDITEGELKKVVVAQKKYTSHNDEVDLFFIQQNLEKLQIKDLQIFCQFYFEHPKTIDTFYEFERKEEDKIRRLISLSAKDKILTTLMIKRLDGLFYSELNENTYGYRFEQSFANYFIFQPWLKQWNIYIKSLQKIIQDEEYENYTLIKIDIKSFYDSINLTKLSEKLLRGNTQRVKDIIEELDFDYKPIYKNICKTLVKYCEEISSKGVPQGPAFARYLADFYLWDFDYFINNSLTEQHVIYFRYVDDIFIFIENTNNLDKIEESIRNYLSRQDLAMNEDKFFKGSTTDYRDKFDSYKDSIKYFIDSASKKSRLLTDKTRSNAVAEMFSLIETESSVKVKSKNLSFFLTHFKNDSFVVNKINELEEMIFSLEEGRGSLFRNFYEFYFKSRKSRKDENLSNHAKSLKGLNREVFINRLLKHCYNTQLSENEALKIRELLSYYCFHCNLSKVEKVLLLNIMLCNQALLIPDWLSGICSSDKNVVLDIINSRLSKNVSVDTFKAIRNLLDEVENLFDLIDLLYNLLFYCELPIHIYSELSSIYFSRIIVSSDARREDFTKDILSLNVPRKQEIVNKQFQITSLLSIVETEDSREGIIEVWRMFVETCNSLEEIEIYSSNWLKIAGRVNINLPFVNSIFAVRVEDGFARGIIDMHKIYLQYYESLLLFIFVHQEEFDTEISEENREQIKQNVEKWNIEFLNWIINFPSTTSLYPNKNVFLKNIQENDMICLRRDGLLLIRISTNEKLKKKLKFNYLNYETHQEDVLMNKTYTNYVIKIDADFIPISSVFKDITTLEGVSLIIKIFDNIDRNISKIADLDKYPDLFYDKCLIHRTDYLPINPFSVLNNSYVSEHKTKKGNDSGKFLAVLFDKLKFTEDTFENYPEFNFEKEKFLSSFAPKKIERISEKFIFLKEFEGFVNDIPTIFHLDIYRFLAIYKYRKAQNESSFTKLLHTILEDYHSCFPQKKDKYKLVFGVEKLTPDDFSILSVYQIIYNSIKSQIENCKITEVEEGILTLLIKEHNSLVKLCDSFAKNGSMSENVETNSVVNEFNSKLDSYKKTEVIVESDPTEIIIDGKEYRLKNNSVEFEGLYIYLTSWSDFVIKPMSTKFLSTLNTKSFLYKTSTNEKCLLIAFDNIIEKTYNTIHRRNRLLEKLNEGTLNADERNIESYLINPTTSTSNLQNHSQFPKALEVLTNHYYKSDKLKTEEALKEHLINWLNIFKEEYRVPLLEVIASHESISHQDSIEFIENLKVLNKNGTLLFSLKTVDDYNGLYALLLKQSSGEELIRDLHLDKFVNLVLNSTETKKLVILSDICISGTQVQKAFEYYFDDSIKTGQADNMRYHEIPEDMFELFKSNLKKVESVVFCFPIYCADTKEKLVGLMSQYLDITKEAVTFKGRHFSLASTNIESNPNITLNSQTMFNDIINDVDYLKKVFAISKDESRSFRSNGNLIVRLNRIPKLGYKIFQLQPLNNHVPPLFNAIGEHKNIK